MSSINMVFQIKVIMNYICFTQYTLVKGFPRQRFSIDLNPVNFFLGVLPAGIFLSVLSPTRYTENILRVILRVNCI